ncbi:MAG: hypothetical protein PGN34_04785 [Methylobacterium frigidaeris]
MDDSAAADHPYFGRVRVEGLSLRLGPARLAGSGLARTVICLRFPVDRFRRSLRDRGDCCAIASRCGHRLRSCVRSKAPPRGLVIRLSELIVRKSYHDDPAAQYPRIPPHLAALGRGLAGPAARADRIPPETFAAAPRLRRARLSLSPEESGGADLTLDYRILPRGRDHSVFVAQFSAAGEGAPSVRSGNTNSRPAVNMTCHRLWACSLARDWSRSNVPSHDLTRRCWSLDTRRSGNAAAS